MAYIAKRNLDENIKRQVGNHVKPIMKKIISGAIDPAQSNNATYAVHTFEGFVDQEFYSKEEVQKTLRKEYYSKKQMHQILQGIEKKMQKGFTDFISSSNSIPMNNLKGIRIGREVGHRYSEEDIIKNVEAGVKGIFDKF